MKPPRSTEEWKAWVLDYRSRYEGTTLFSGYIYRFLVELLREDDKALPEKYPDLDSYYLAHLTTYQIEPQQSQHHSATYTFSQLNDLVQTPLPRKGHGQVLFLCGHLPGSWISGIGAKYGIGREFFRRHIHLWRSSEGPVLYAVPRLPSVTSGKGLVLRIRTHICSMRPIDNFSLAKRLQVLPGTFEPNPQRLTAVPGSTYVRGHAVLSDHDLVVEQDISITIESDGDGWTAILWSDVGNRDLAKSVEFHQFMDYLRPSSHLHPGLNSTRLISATMVGKDAELRHPLPPLALEHKPDTRNLVQWASHIPVESHLILDHAIAAQDPVYALTPVLSYAAHGENGALAIILKRYEIITSTVWDPKKSTEQVERLIHHKHLLDDHASRYEEVLRFLRSPALSGWTSTLTAEQAEVAADAKRSVIDDYEYLLARTRQFSIHHQDGISTLVSSVAVAESQKQIILATQVTKLTVLATIFLLLSYCTSIFGMNFVELDGLSIWIWAIVTIVVGLATFVTYQWSEKHRFTEKCYKGWTQASNKLRYMAESRPTSSGPV